MKVIAFYLPQFHQIKENDEWWGEGFTEWVNVKRSKALFENHNQPRIPFENKYYNLLDIETHKWQSELMNQYNIYGLCYYHYWFKGKKLLEKPMELLLENKNINIKYCISWANEPWTRSWDGKTKDILIDQNYGDEKDWEEHFNYLVKFFKDERYIKIDNKPLFVIYRTNNIDRCEEMINLWNNLSIQNGFDGIYIVETMNSFQNKPALNLSQAVIEFEPMFTLKHHMNILTQALRFKNKKLEKLDKFKYDEVWNNILKRNISYNGKSKFSGGFVDWDNSPRKGKKGTVAIGASPEKFEGYLSDLFKKCYNEGNDQFIFINAWNEWAEGTYLEPDSKYEHSYLNAIKNVTDKYKYGEEYEIR